MTPVVIGLRGDVDLAARDSVVATLDDGVARARSAAVGLMVDLSGVTFLDSTGIGCLVRAVNALDREGLALTLCCPPPGVQRVLEISGLDRIVADPAHEGRPGVRPAEG